MKTEVKSIGNIDVFMKIQTMALIILNFLILTMCRICKPHPYILIWNLRWWWVISQLIAAPKAAGACQCPDILKSITCYIFYLFAVHVMTEYRLCGVHGCDNDKQVDLITAGDWTCITISVLVEVPVIQPLQLPAAQNNMSFDNSALEQKLAQVYHLQYPLGIIRHINPQNRN